MSTHTTDSPPRTVKCRTTADFLAALPELTGFTATDCIFVVFFSGKRSGQAARIDLPKSEDPREITGFLNELCTLLFRVADDDGGKLSGLAVVISTTLSFAEVGGPPWRKLARRIKRRLERERIGVRELCRIAADGWIGFLDPAAPLSGRPLSEIVESEVGLDLARRGVSIPPLEDLGAIPAPDPQRAQAVAAALAAIEPYKSGATPDPGRPQTATPPFSARVGSSANSGHGIIGLPPMFHETAEVGGALRNNDAELTPQMTARLIRSAGCPGRWLLLAIGILTRPEFAAELASEMSPDWFCNMPVGIDRPDSPRAKGWSVYRLLASLCPDFTEQTRLHGLKRRLTTAIAETPEELRAGLLCLSGWVWWLGGSQTVAHRQLDAALKLDPEHEVAQMIKRLIDIPAHIRTVSFPHERRASA